MYYEYTIPSDAYIGSISGHINLTIDSIEFKNYFEINQKMNNELIKLIKSKLKGEDFSILMNMNVEEDYRKQGYGQELINNFFSYSDKIVIIIADISEKVRF